MEAIEPVGLSGAEAAEIECLAEGPDDGRDLLGEQLVRLQHRGERRSRRHQRVHDARVARQHDVGQSRRTTPRFRRGSDRPAGTTAPRPRPRARQLRRLARCPTFFIARSVVGGTTPLRRMRMTFWPYSFML